MEALVLQQEIAEELERERKRNKKELSALQHTNATISRQRDESRRVVLHLRSLIDGQTHHMEHIVQSLNEAPELNAYLGQGYEDVSDDLDDSATDGSASGPERLPRIDEAQGGASPSPTDQKVTPDMGSHFFSSLTKAKPASRLSIVDAADRHLRDKTDAIAYIIRNISDQCAAAVEGLQLAHEAEDEPESHNAIDPALQNRSNSSHHAHTASDGDVSMHTDVSGLAAQDGDHGEADSGHGGSTGHLTPQGERGQSRNDSRAGGSIPPTPDLIGGRSSTSMSGYSNSTGTTGAAGRDSQQWLQNSNNDKTRIFNGSEADAHDSGSEVGTNNQIQDVVQGKKHAVDVVRPLGRIVP